MPQSPEALKKTAEMYTKKRLTGPSRPVGVRTITPRGYWEDPQVVARYYNVIRSAPPGWQPPKWLDTKTITEAYAYLRYRNQYKPVEDWKWLPDDDPATQFLRGITPPPDNVIWPTNNRFVEAKPAAPMPQQPNGPILNPYEFAQQMIEKGELSQDFKLQDIPGYAQNQVGFQDLEDWQKWALAFLYPQAQIANRPEGNRLAAIAARSTVATLGGIGIGSAIGGVIGGGIGALAGGVGFLPGAAIGAKIGAWAGGLIAGGGTAYSLYGNTDIPALTETLNLFDILSIGTERGIGLSGQISESSLKEVMSDLPAAWRAASVSYESSDYDILNLWAALAGDQTAGEGEVWRFSEGFTEPVKLEGSDKTGADAVLEAKGRYHQLIEEGLTPRQATDQLITEYSQKFGDTALANEFIYGTILDPANIAPGAIGKVGQFAFRKSNPALSRAFAVNVGNPIIDALPFPLQPLAAAIFKQPASGGLFSTLRTYADWVHQGYIPKQALGMPKDMRKKYRQLLVEGVPDGKIKVEGNLLKWVDKDGKEQTFKASRAVVTEVPTVEELSKTTKFLIGIDDVYGLSELRPSKNMNWFVRLFRLDQASQANILLNLYHQIMSTLMDRANGDPEQMVKFYRQASGEVEVKPGDPGERILKSPAMRAIREAIKNATLDKGLLENMLADWMSVAGGKDASGNHVPGKRDLLLKVSEALDLKPAEVLQMLKDKPEVLASLLNEKASTLGTPAMIKDLLKVFIGDDALPWNEMEFQARLVNRIADNMDKYLADTYGLKPDHWVFRVSQVLKGVQSLVLLGWNPAYFLNNQINNMVTRAATGVFGYMTPQQINTYLDRFGIIPPRLDVGASPGDEGAIYGGRRIIQDAKDAGDALAKAYNAVRIVNRKLGIFSRLSASFEKMESRQSQVLGIKTFMRKTWKRDNGFERMHPALEAAIDKVAPGMSDVLYGAIEAGLNISEIENAIFGSYIKPSIQHAVESAAAKVFPHAPDIGIEILNKLGLVDELVKGLREAETPEQVDAVFRNLEANLRRIIDERHTQELIHLAEQTRNLVETERIPAILEIHSDLERQQASMWLAQRRQWDELYARYKTMTPEEWEVAVKELFAAQNKEWGQFYQTQIQTYDGILKALRLSDLAVAKEYLTLMASIQNTWREFHQKADEMRSRFFKNRKRGGDEDYEAYRIRRDREWNTLQDKLEELYQKHAKIEGVAQLTMDNLFAQVYQAYTGWNPIRAQAWRSLIQTIRAELVRMQREVRRRTRNMTVEEKDAVYAEFNPVYNHLIAQMKRAEIVGAQWIREQPRAGETLDNAIKDLRERMFGREEGIQEPERAPRPDEPEPPTMEEPPDEQGIPVMITNKMTKQMRDLGIPEDVINKVTPVQAWDAIRTEMLSKARQAGLVGDDKGVRKALLNIINYYLKQEGKPEIKRPEEAHIADLDAALAAHIKRHEADTAKKAANVKITLDDIAKIAERERRIAYIQQHGRLTRSEIREQMKAAFPSEDPQVIDSVMMLIDAFADQYATRNGYAANDATRDAWYATRIAEILQGEEGGEISLQQTTDVMTRLSVMLFDPAKQPVTSEFRPLAEPTHMKIAGEIPSDVPLSSRQMRLQTLNEQWWDAGRRAGLPDSTIQVMWDILEAGQWPYKTMYQNLGATELQGMFAEVWNTMHNPLYQGTKGESIFLSDGRAVIRASKAGDVTTMVHELAHIFRRDLPEHHLDAMAKLGGLENAAELRMLERKYHFGIEGDKYEEYHKLNKHRAQLDKRDQTRLEELEHDADVADMRRYVHAEELFARGWERYLIEGFAPTPAQRGLFKRFSEWMMKIYPSLQKKNGRITGFEGTSLDVDIHAELRNGISLREIYDHMLTGDIERPPTLEALVKSRAESIQSVGRNYRLTWSELSRRGLREMVTEILSPFKNIAEAREVADNLGEQMRYLADGTPIDDAAIYDAIHAVENDPSINPWVTKKADEVRGTTTTAHGITDVLANYEFTHKVIDANDIITSNRWRGDELIVREDYPQELQPRERNQAQNIDQVETIAKQLVPEDLLFDARSLDRGSPIVGPDNVAESGNGRVLAIVRAAERYPERWQAYLAKLQEYAVQYGIDPAEFENMKIPILVRERTTPLTHGDRVDFVNDANSRVTQAMNEAEIAHAETRFISDEALANLEVAETETIDAALLARKNAEFVNQFLNRIPKNERAALSENGVLTQAGLERIKNAIFVKVFPGEAGDKLLRLFKMSTESNMRAVQSGVFAALPQLAKIEAMIQAGQRAKDLSIGLALAEALERYATLPTTGMKPAEFLASIGLFGDNMSGVTRALFSFIAFKATAKNIKLFMREYARLVMNEPDPRQLSLMDMQVMGSRQEELVLNAIKNIEPTLEGEVAEIMQQQPELFKAKPMESTLEPVEQAKVEPAQETAAETAVEPVLEIKPEEAPKAEEPTPTIVRPEDITREMARDHVLAVINSGQKPFYEPSDLMDWQSTGNQPVFGILSELVSKGEIQVATRNGKPIGWTQAGKEADFTPMPETRPEPVVTLQPITERTIPNQVTRGDLRAYESEPGVLAITVNNELVADAVLRNNNEVSDLEYSTFNPPNENTKTEINAIIEDYENKYHWKKTRRPPPDQTQKPVPAQPVPEPPTKTSGPQEFLKVSMEKDWNSGNWIPIEYIAKLKLQLTGGDPSTRFSWLNNILLFFPLDLQPYARDYATWLLGGKQGKQPPGPPNLLQSHIKDIQLRIEEMIRDQRYRIDEPTSGLGIAYVNHKSFKGDTMARQVYEFDFGGHPIIGQVYKNGKLVAYLPSDQPGITAPFDTNGTQATMLGLDPENPGQWVFEVDGKIVKVDPNKPHKAPEPEQQPGLFAPEPAPEEPGSLEPIGIQTPKPDEQLDLFGLPVEPEPEAPAIVPDIPSPSASRETQLLTKLNERFNLETGLGFDKPSDFENFIADLGFNLESEKDLNLAYDIMEGVFNVQARKLRARLDAEGAGLGARIDAMIKLENTIVRARRTIAKMQLQQFSTPLPISEAAAWAADARPGDVIGEPTAGTGNLIDRFYGMEGVTIKVNELDPNRQKVLSMIGYQPTGLNLMAGEWVNAPQFANVAVANPPWGSYSTGKYGRAVHWPVTLNDWSQRFTYLTVQKMPAGSRFVGVMPLNWLYTVDRATRGMTVRRSEFLKWLDNNYWVRGIIESPEGAYDTRATGVGSLLVIIDKVLPFDRQPELPLEAWGVNAPKDWISYANLVKEFGEGGSHARTLHAIEDGQLAFGTHREPAAGPERTGLVDPAAVKGESRGDPERIGQPAAEPGAAPRAEPTAAAARAAEPSGEPVTPAVGRIGTQPGEQPGRAGGESPETLEAKPAAPEPGGSLEPAAGRPLEPERTGGQPGRGEPTTRTEPQPGRVDVVESGTERGDTSAELVGGQPSAVPQPVSKPVYEYSEQFINRLDECKRAVTNSRNFTLYVGRSPLREGVDFHAPHPDAIVETKNLAGVPYPKLEDAYRPSTMVMEALNNRLLSVEGNLDPIWAAIQQNEKHNSAILIADDVGIGKSRTAAGYVLDRIEKGRRRILVVTKGAQNVDNLMNKVFPGVYRGEADEYGYFTRIPKDYPAERVLLSGKNYPEVKKGEATLPRFERPAVYFISEAEFMYFKDAILDLAPDVVVVDEAHQFKSTDTKRAEAWYALHKDWLNRSVNMMYLTATPGIDISELRYLYGLRVWTIDGFGDWVSMITGKISPERAKALQIEQEAFSKWVETLANDAEKVDFEWQIVEDRHNSELRGTEIGELVLYPNNMGDLWTVYYPASTYSGREWIALPQHRALLFADIYRGVEGNSIGAKFMEAKRILDERYPPPELSRETKIENRIDEADDILSDPKKNRKWGKKASANAFEFTLPPSHTEQIMRELKLGGYYMSRDISRAGVEFDVKEFKLSPNDLSVFDKRVKLYRRIYEAWREFGAMNEGPKRAAALFGITGDIQADAKRTLFDLRLPGVIAEADAALARGEKVVISIVSVSGVDDEGGSLNNAISKINTQEVRNLGEGQFTNPAEIPEALIEIANIRDELSLLPEIKSPIDLLLAKYGDRIGFIHGQVPAQERIAVTNAFKSDKLDVIVISGAGKTGISLHDVTGKRQVHLIVGDFEWSASTFKQELGRVDRSGQKSSPMVTVMHTGSAAERKFVATISNRMKGLGAVCKGGGESTGTSALVDSFELGSSLDKYALAETWHQLSPEHKRMFLDKYFEDREVKGAMKSEIDQSAQSIKKFLLGLQAIPLEIANYIFDQFLEIRDRLAESDSGKLLEEKEASRTANIEGQLLRETNLGENLRMFEVKDPDNHRLGILEGVLTPHMNHAKQIISPYAIDNSWMRWTRFYDDDKQRYISGLRVPISNVIEMMNSFGTRVENMHRPETALIDLGAGDRINIHGANGENWKLYMGRSGFRDGKVIVEGARMAHRNPLMNNGAMYDARGNFFWVPEDNLQNFFARFPINNDADPAAVAVGRSLAQLEEPFVLIDSQRAIIGRGLNIDAAEVQRLEGIVETARQSGKYPGVLEVEFHADSPLSPIERILEAKTAEYFEQHLEEIKTEYYRRNGNVLNVDEARELIPEYVADRTLAIGTHEPCSALIKHLFKEQVNRLVDLSVEENRAQFLAGGAGSGKTSANIVNQSRSRTFKFILDGVLDNYEKARAKLEEVLAADPNVKVEYTFVYRPAKSAVISAIERAIIDGRPVPIDILVPGHITALETVLRLYDEGFGGGRIIYRFVDNSGEFGTAHYTDVEFLRTQLYNEITTAEELLDVYFREYESGNIPAGIHQGVTGGRSRENLRDDIIANTRRRTRDFAPTQRRTTRGREHEIPHSQPEQERAGVSEEVRGVQSERRGGAGLEQVETGRAGDLLGENPPGQIPRMEPHAQTLIESFGDYIAPLLARTRDEYKAGMKRKFKMGDLSPELQDGVRSYLNSVYDDLSSTKLAAMRYGEQLRDAALLNYSRRYGVDNILNLIFPYQFWYTRSMMQWALRMVDKPSWYAMFARMRRIQEEMERKGVPSRLRGKLRIPMAWLPDWMGDSIWIDPLKQFMPFTQFTQPFERWTMDQSQIAQRAEYLVRKMAENGLITKTEAEQAISTRQGIIWERARKEAEIETDKDSSPLNLAGMMMSPALWVSVPMNLASGTPEKISTLPITRYGQSVRTALQGTGLERVGNLAGAVMAGPEEAIRERAGLSRYGEWGDYYIERQLSNMAADGEISTDDALIAQIQRSGPAYDLAIQRVAQEMALRTPGTLPIMALKEGASPIEVAAAIIASLFPAGLFPTGELKLRGLKGEYDKAWENFKAGDESALNRFFDQYPEYETRLALYDKPEERLRQFLVSEIWDRYTKLEKVNRRQAREALGQEFIESFLEARAYDTTDIKQLAMWAQTLGAMLPKVEELEGLPQTTQPEYYPPEEAQIIDYYNNERNTLFPNWYALQQQYYALPPGAQRKQFLRQFPQLKDYWTWKHEFEKQYPDIKNYLNERSRNSIEDDINELNSLLLRQLLAYALADQPMGSGAEAELTRIWEANRRKGGSLEEYIKMLLQEIQTMQ